MESVLVTGASRGIGFEMVRQYGLDGNWRVFACCRRPQRSEALTRFASTFKERVSVHPLDITDQANIESLARELDHEAIDLLINNAGLYGPHGQVLGQIDVKSWLEVLKVNTIAPLKMSEAFAGHVGRSSRKVIATISSRMGSVADNTSGNAYAYRSSKAGVNMVMKSLSIDLRERGITCVTLNPGWVRTDMGTRHAPLSVEESVHNMRTVLASVRLNDSGRWFNHDGTDIPW
ncbi:MAG: SDR family oxidoreductase [Candidatus Polarisedimenticolia bacterium]